MPNHVHLILVPSVEDGLRSALAATHRRYTRFVNLREGWKGHLWQERFASFPMDERHLMAAWRYVELNPVRARLVSRAEDWAWSSVHAHLSGGDDGLTNLAPAHARVEDWSAFLRAGLDDPERDALRNNERNGHPLGSEDFVTELAAQAGHALGPRKRGRPLKI